MFSPRPQFLVSAAVAAALLLPAAATAQGPPPPTAVNGNAVTTVATGVTTPTAFAFTGDTIFAGSGPSEDPSSHGLTGLFTLAGGKATQVPGTAPVVSGLAWHDDKLYVSAFTKIIAYSGWDGTKFASSKTVTSGLKGGYNGIAFGPDNRLYAGVSFREKFDPGGDPSPHAQSVISMTATGKNIKTVAKGLRQPFQLYFPQGSKFPYVGVLGQEKGKIPEDAIVVAKPGENYGYPKCQFGFASTCKGFTKPLITLPKHASPMGITSIGSTLYVSLFGGIGDGKPVVATLPVKGGKPKPFLTGFAAPVIALGQNAGKIYVGDLTGTIYSVDAG
jgi:glucose/arabinose dehydrogenase